MSGLPIPHRTSRRVQLRQVHRISAVIIGLFAAEGLLDWSRVHELGEVVAGRRMGRQSASEINLFESNGLAIQDVAAAQVVYEKARAAGIGTELPIG